MPFIRAWAHQVIVHELKYVVKMNAHMSVIMCKNIMFATASLFHLLFTVDFEKKGEKETCPILDQFLSHVARTGETM